MITTELWPLAREALSALAEHYGPVLTQVFTDAGFEERDWMTLYRALLFDPEPVTAAQLQQVFAPYTAAHVFEERFRRAAEGGLLTPVEDGYRLSEQGRALIRRSLEAGYARMAELRPLAPEDLERLAALAKRLVDSILATPEPPVKRCTRANHRLDPGQAAPALVRIDQYLSDLGDFRDDAHMAAWRLYNVAGHAWEVFTLLWREGPATPAALTDKLPHRGYTEADYTDALRELAARSWVEDSGGVYHITEKGRVLRQQAEATTERYFYAPWSVLNEPEQRDLRDLLTRLRDALRAK
jgi:DNA-binding PadR family transcriptional regulator